MSCSARRARCDTAVRCYVRICAVVTGWRMSSTGFAPSLPVASLLRFGSRQGKTVVLAARSELPLILQRPLRGPAGQAVATLLTPAGALFGGDSPELEVCCEPGTDVTLTT